MNMNKFQSDKEWLGRILPPIQREKKSKIPLKASPSTEKSATTAQKKGGGLQDIAGMTELKLLITESFINVLKTGNALRSSASSHPVCSSMGLQELARLSLRRKWPKKSASTS